MKRVVMMGVFSSVGVLSMAVCVSSVHAAQSFDKPQATPPITVSPAIVEWIVSPGEEQRKIVRISNNGDDPLPIRAVAKRFEVQQQVVKEDASIFDASSLFSFETPDFILQPRSMSEVAIVLRAPRDVGVGGRYATAYFRQMTPPLATRGAVAVGQVGVLMFVVVKGDLKPSLAVEERVHLAAGESGRTLAMTLANTGNVHLLPQGRIVVKDWRGRAVASPALEPGVILPGTKRTYSVPLSLRWPIGRFTVVTDVSYASSKLPPEATRATIWLLPPWYVWAVTGAAIVAGVLAWNVRHRWVRAWHALRAK